MSGPSALAAKIGRGLVAGAIGTAAMTVASTIEQKARGREASTAPADAAMKVLGIAGFCDDAAKSRFSNAVHWAYGTAWGVPRALLDVAGVDGAAATAAHGAALWGSEQVDAPGARRRAAAVGVGREGGRDRLDPPRRLRPRDERRVRGARVARYAMTASS